METPCALYRMASCLALWRIPLASTVVLLFSSLLVLLPITGVTSFDFLKRFPTPHTDNNKVLGMLLDFNLGHIDPLVIILSEYQSMCEIGWDPTLVVFSTVKWSDRLHKYFHSKTFCYRTNASIPMYQSVFPAEIGTSLAAEHRKYMQSVVNEYDLFIYHEDDIIVRAPLLTAFTFETRRQYNLQGIQGVNESIVGFLRYRWHLRPEESRGHVNDENIFNQEFYEETPKFNPYCLEPRDKDGAGQELEQQSVPYLAVVGNSHQAMWMMTRTQVLLFEQKCRFLYQSSPSREYMSSFSLYNDLPWACGLSKIIPGEHLVTFSVLHYYPALHPSEALQVHRSDENIRAGYFPWMPLLKSDYYDWLTCWKPILQASYAEQYENVSDPYVMVNNTMPYTAQWSNRKKKS